MKKLILALLLVLLSVSLVWAQPGPRLGILVEENEATPSPSGFAYKLQFSPNSLTLSDAVATISVQASDADLTTIAGLTPTKGDILLYNTAWTNLAIGNEGELLVVNASDLLEYTATPTFSSLTAPNSATESANIGTAGEIGIDTTDDQLLYYGGAQRVITYKHRQCFTLEDPADADDNLPIFSLDDAMTITRLDCIVKGGTSAVVVLNDGTNDLDSMTCATTMTSDTSMSGNNTFTALELVEADVGTVTGAVEWVNFCFTYTITVE